MYTCQVLYTYTTMDPDIDTILHRQFPLLGTHIKSKDGTKKLHFTIKACPGDFAYREPWISFVPSSADNLNGDIIMSDGSDHTSNHYEGRYELIINGDNSGILKISDLNVTIVSMFDSDETSECDDFETTFTFDTDLHYEGVTNGENHNPSLDQYFEANCTVKFTDSPVYPSLKGHEYRPYGIDKPLFSVKRIQTISEFANEDIDVTPDGYTAYNPRDLWISNMKFDEFFSGFIEEVCEFVSKYSEDVELSEMIRTNVKNLTNIYVIYTYKLEICYVIMCKNIFWEGKLESYFLTHVIFDPKHKEINMIDILARNRFIYWPKYLIVPDYITIYEAIDNERYTIHETELIKENRDHIKGEAANIYSYGKYKHYELSLHEKI